MMNKSGFTLIELLIAMTISTIVAAGVVTAYRSQQNTQLAQKQSVEMQQNLRAALYIMTRDIRMAGYNPDGINGTGIVNAGNGSDNANRLTFTYYNADAANDGTDNDNDGTTADVDEMLQSVEYYLYDSSIDTDTLVDDLGRRNGARLDSIAENIQSLQFVYLDNAGAPTATLADVRAVQITIIATTDSNELNYTNGNRTLTTTVKCRNLGL
jgi:type IV pilus assembly protein PilW